MTGNPLHAVPITISLLAAIALSGCGSSPSDTEVTEPVADLVPGPGLSASDSGPVVAADAESTLLQSLSYPGNVFPALTATLYRTSAPGPDAVGLSTDLFVDTIYRDAQGAYVINYVIDGTPGTVTIAETDATGGGEYRVDVDGTPFYFWSWTTDPYDQQEGFLRYMDTLLLNPHFQDDSYRMWFVFGVRTETPPSTGSATYLGRFQARTYKASDPDRQLRSTMTGAMRLVANFDMNELQGEIGAIRHTEASSEWTTSSFEIANGRIKDGQFTATLIGRDSDPNTSFDESLRGFTGALLGEFYGPGADEVGAVVSAQRDEAGDDHDRVLYGYIGGKNVEELAAAARASGLHPLSGRLYGNGKDALIVLAHGDVGPNSPSDYLYGRAEELSERFPNATVVAVLRPGHFDSEGRVSPGANNWRDTYTDENNELLAETVKNLKDAINPEKVVVVGHSGGSAQFGVVIGLDQFPNLVDGAVLTACPCDVAPWREHRNATAGRTGTWPNSRSPTEYVDTVGNSTKVIALTGSHDPNTLPRFAHEYIEALRSLGVDAEFMLVDGEDHGYTDAMHAAVVSAVGRILTDAPDGDLGYLSVAVDRDHAGSDVQLTTAAEVTAIESDKTGGFRVAYLIDGQEKTIDFELQDYVPSYESYLKQDGDRSYWLWNLATYSGVPKYDHFDVRAWEVDEYVAGSTSQLVSQKRGFTIFGTPTATSDLPAGTATYTGRAYGQTFTVDSSGPRRVGSLTGALTLDANFAQGMIEGSIYDMEYNPRGQPSVSTAGEFTIGNGAITDNAFTADLTGMHDYADFRGDMEGRFFGPAAEEVGGVMGGTFNTTNETMLGYFGASGQ